MDALPQTDEVSNETCLTRWRLNSPFMQTLIVGVAIFCGPGMNTAVIGLGAGGSRPSNIPTVDKVNVVNGAILSAAAFLGGSVNNLLGPRLTLMLGASGYPLYIGSLWFLDNGDGVWFPYVVAVYHGVAAALFYSAAGYVITCYSPEHDRGKYIGGLWAFNAAGSVLGSSVVLAITATRSSHQSHVPTAVYITIVCIQSLGILAAALLVDPSRVRRNDGRAIANFKALGIQQELLDLPRTICTPGMLLAALGLFSCQMPVSLAGSLNGFYFNGRTRALVNLLYWISVGAGCLFAAVSCDAKWLGLRRRRGILTFILSVAFIIGPFVALLWFLSTHTIDRKQKPPGVDWSDNSAFTTLAVIYVFLGCSLAIFQSYLHWVCSTFSNRPAILSRFNGYVEGLKALGLVTAFGIDSNSVAFLTEGAAYLSLLMVGAILSLFAVLKYTTDSKYGVESDVIPPLVFEAKAKQYVYLRSTDTEKVQGITVMPKT